MERALKNKRNLPLAVLAAAGMIVASCDAEPVRTARHASNSFTPEGRHMSTESATSRSFFRPNLLLLSSATSVPFAEATVHQPPKEENLKQELKRLRAASMAEQVALIRARDSTEQVEGAAEIAEEALALPLPPKGFSPELKLWLATLGFCESRSTPTENDGNGYYGEFQFSRVTWDNLDTGYARADLAPEAVQESAIVENTLQAKSGLGSQNPSCFKSEHLSRFPPA